MRMLLVLSFVLAAGAAWGDEDLAAFWQRGHVRELLASGIPGMTPAEWAATGVNCVMGIPPKEAHAAGLKTRTWFTMNLIGARTYGGDLARIQAMCAVNADGSYRRPYDPLFPTVAENWSACVNNPLWREYSADVFRRMARDEWDGCHIDYASHYEPCFCKHCEERWAQYCAGHGLEVKTLRGLPDDLRTRMHLQEFRIRSVMDFLGMVRAEARKIRPGFSTDGTYHQDSGSAYQWAYGDHFDLMCIEGTTWDRFPPESQQLLWLKVSHALSRGKVGMSVTYHLVNDGGERHHGRTAPDRTKLALCEILSQGAVSWLGLGGPKTGNLLREHAAMVKDVYRTWAELDPYLTTREDVGEVGIVFSPRSMLASGGARRQLYAVGQALMRLHVPFVIHSDVDLTAAKLAACPATVLLDAQALSTEATQALEGYVRDGGKLLVFGAVPQYAPDWSALPKTPDLLQKPKGAKGLSSREVGGKRVWYYPGEATGGARLGAAQNVTVNQQQAAPLAVEGESKALNVSGSPDGGYSVYVDITYQDGSNLWGQIATFGTGTHDWESARCIITPEKPVKSANVHLLLREHSGTVWFRKVRLGPWDAATQQITRNLLGEGLNPRGGAYAAGPGQDASRGVWGPYASGFEVEEIAGEGPTVKLVAAGSALSVGAMHTLDPVGLKAAAEILAPVLPARPMLRLEGERAEGVTCDVSRCRGGMLLQFLNYNAELHPELPEMEQQKVERSLPVAGLRVTFTPPGGKKLGKLTLKVPGQPDAPLATDGTHFTLPRLEQYAAVVAELR